MDNQEKSQEEAKKAFVLEQINKVQLENGGFEWKGLPEILPGCEILRDKRLVMVDDMRSIFMHFSPNFIAATDGKASFIEFHGQELEDIVSEILKDNPDIVLLDNDLGWGMLTGPEIAGALKQTGFTGDIVGFSTEDRSAKKFMQAGATGFLIKENSDLRKKIKELADLITKK